MCRLLKSFLSQSEPFALGEGLFGQIMPGAHCQSLSDIFPAESLPQGCLIPCVSTVDLSLTPQNFNAVQAAISTEPLHRSGVSFMRLVQAFL